MREHLYRGFHPDENGTTEIIFDGEKIKGEWQYWNEFGCLVDISDIAVIDVVVVAEIIKETVCEYVKDDCNGNKVFENDIVKVKFWSDWGECYEKSNGTIKWENGKYIIHISHYSMRLDLCDHPEMELVGNIFESQ